MISVGIDVAKGKSTVCILKPYGEIVSKPFDISHVEKDLRELAVMLLRFDDEVRVVMEAMGVYHLPVLTYLQEKGLFVAVINPYVMKVYRSGDLRKAKTDKIDSRMIANYGIKRWFTMAEFKAADDVYGELKILGQQYRHYMKLHIMSLHELTHLLDYTMHGIKGMLASWNEGNRKDELSDFVERFWRYDTIICLSETEFIKHYTFWAKENTIRVRTRRKPYMPWPVKAFLPYPQKPHPSKCW